MNKKRRFLKPICLLVTLFLLISSVPTAFALPNTLDVTSTGTLYINADSSYSTTGIGTQGYLDQDTLIISNNSLTIFLADGVDITIDSINVTGSLIVTPASGATGTGILKTASNTAAYCIRVTSSLTVDACALTAAATASGSGGIYVIRDVIVKNGGVLEGSGEIKGITIDGDVSVNGTLKAETKNPYGLVVSGAITLYGGTISGSSTAFGVAALGGITVLDGVIKGTAIGNDADSGSGDGTGTGTGTGTGDAESDVSVGLTGPAYGIYSGGNITVSGGEVWGFASGGEGDTVGVFIEESGFDIVVTGGTLVGEACIGDTTSTNPDKRTFGVYNLGGIFVQSNAPNSGKLVALTDETGLLGKPYYCTNGAPAGDGVYDHKYSNAIGVFDSDDVTSYIPSSIFPSQFIRTNTAVLYRAGVTESYHVTFDGNGSNVANVPAQITNILGGSVITKPALDPTRAGYTFTGWYTSSQGGVQWNFASNTVTSNITLYAHWSSNASTLATETNTSVPVTGDNEIPAVYSFVLVASGLVIAFLILRTKKEVEKH